MAYLVELTQPRVVRIREYPVPDVGSGEVGIRTFFSGISAGTELATYRGTNPYLEKRWDPDLALFIPGATTFHYPVDVWGYSEVGVVQVLGGGVSTHQIGDVVSGVWGHRSHAAVPSARLIGHVLPVDLAPKIGTFDRVGAVALNAVLAAAPNIGETVAVFGQGVIGLLATQLLVSQGIDVLAVDNLPARLELAQKLGATAVSGREGDVAVHLRELAGGGRGPDRVIEMTGSYAALHQAIRCAGVDGIVVAAGFYQGAASALALGEEFHHNRVRLVSSQIGALHARPAGSMDPGTLARDCDAADGERSARPHPADHPRDPGSRGGGSVPAARRPARGPDAGAAGLHRWDRMNTDVQLSIQEQHLHGATLVEKWQHARRLGFDAIELRGAGEGRFAARLPELRAAAAAGVQMPTVCVEMLHFVGDFDAGKRADAVAQMKSQLSVMAEIGGRLAMTPASYGMFSTRLPPFIPPRSPAEDAEALLEAFGALAAHAQSEGVVIALEPLNRYEDHMINTLGQAQALCSRIGSPAFGIAADTYHMNIEEADPPQALVEAGPWIRHIQLSDSNRLEPGSGHIDWFATLRAIRSIGYSGELAYECRLSGPVDEVLPASVRRMREAAVDGWPTRQ